MPRDKGKWHLRLRENWLAAMLSTVALILIHVFLLSPAYRGSSIDATKAAQFGDFIGGYLGTIFLIVSVASFLVSYRNQRLTNERISFESRFFELLKYHRENVSEIGIGGKSGRRTFVFLVREFRETLNITSECAENLGIKLDQRQKINLAYLAFYYGVGENSSRLLQEAARLHFRGDLIDKVINELLGAVKEVYKGRWEVNGYLQGYRFFNGHQSRLAHYFRHFYQTVKYAAEHAPEGKSKEYVDIARVQLTNHEQAILCLNCLSSLGKAWLDKGYLNSFGLIKNLPKDFFDPVNELDIKSLFPEIAFEYEEMSNPELFLREIKTTAPNSL